MKNKIVIFLIIFFSVLRCFNCYCQSKLNDIVKSSGNDNYYDYGNKAKMLECPLLKSEPDGTINQHYKVTEEAKVGFWASKTNSITLNPGFEASGFASGSFIAWFDDAGNYISNGICNGTIINTDNDDIISQTYDPINPDAILLSSKTYNSCWECLPNGKEINEHKAEKVKVALANKSEWNDKVFNNDYKLMSLSELDKFLKENKHLPEIPSEKEVINNGGFELGEMTTLLLKKVEELTLYIIQQDKKIEELQKQVLKNK